jgi:hypothetical protein
MVGCLHAIAPGALTGHDLEAATCGIAAADVRTGSWAAGAGAVGANDIMRRRPKPVRELAGVNRPGSDRNNHPGDCLGTLQLIVSKRPTLLLEALMAFFGEVAGG